MEYFHVASTGAVQLSEIPSVRFDSGFLWIDCIYSDVAALNRVLETYQSVQLLAEHLQDASNRNHPSYFDSTSRYEMIVFRGLAMHPSNLAEKVGQIRLETRPSTFFIAPGVLVTVHAQSSRTFARLRERLLAICDEGTRSPNSPEELMLRTLNEMVDRFMELRDPLGNMLGKAQFELLDPKKPFRDWPLLLSWRMELQRLESLSEEQLDALQEWLDERHDRSSPTNSSEPLNDSLMVRTNNVIEHINRVLSHAARLESTLESAVQLHFSSMAHRSTEIMRVLTVLTAIFMPLTLISGIFGMNFESIPGLKSPDGFWWVLGGMLMVATVMYGWFRAQRWVNTRGTQFSSGLKKPRTEHSKSKSADQYSEADASS